MNLRDHALAILEGTTLDAKLHTPAERPVDEHPGAALRVDRPHRPERLAIVPHAQTRVPPPEGMRDPAQRARILHALANHELQAAELFAWALLAFPDAPSSFRQGCWKIVGDEQRHCRLYLERLAALGATFGDWPLSAHFWNKIASIRTPLEFVCTMGLTFENANLDFCQEHIEAARAAGDEETATVLEVVHRDEVGHVRFAWNWLVRWKTPDETAWDAYLRTVAPPLGPHRARGRTFDAEARRAAGIDEAFIAGLDGTNPTRPGGAAR